MANGQKLIAQLVHNDEFEVVRANARLIASAPALRDALKEMVSAMWQHFEYHHDGDDEFDNDHCQRAIDQARVALNACELIES